jgi:hypothetical protein
LKDAKDVVGLPVSIRGPVGAKTQPTGTTLVDVVVDELLLEVVEMTVDDVVDELVEATLLEVVECVEVVAELLEPSVTPRPVATTTRTMTTAIAATLPIPMREFVAFNSQNQRASIFKTSPGCSTIFGAQLTRDLPLSLRGQARRL